MNVIIFILFIIFIEHYLDPLNKYFLFQVGFFHQPGFAYPSSGIQTTPVHRISSTKAINIYVRAIACLVDYFITNVSNPTTFIEHIVADFVQMWIVLS